MDRLRIVALVVSLCGAMPVMAGSTSFAKPEGAGAPSLSCAVEPTTGEAGAASAEGLQSIFEMLVADFRWGAPTMGAGPHLRIPPPHRMRAGELTCGAPLDVIVSTGHTTRNT